MLGIAVEPEFCILKRAPCERLLNKRPRHKRGFIKQNASQGHTLDQRSGGFIAPAEKLKAVAHAVTTDLYKIAAQFVITFKTEGGKHGNQRRDHITPERSDRLAAYRKSRFIKAVKRPAHKGYAHAQRFAGTHCAVAYDAVFVFSGAAGAPPS